MCGILVIYSKKKSLNINKCNNSLQEITNRGPDKILKEYFASKKLFIANTVLSIVGKLKNGNKLYKSKSKRYFLSYNGEIYNYKNLNLKLKNFKNITDSEVLINLFDKKSNKEIAKSLDGMFAYSVFDKKLKKIFIGTDVQGEKKIFYFNNKDYFIISSNINAILSFTGQQKLNHKKLKEYFSTRHLIFNDSTIYKNIDFFKEGYVYQYDLKKNLLKREKFDDPVNWIKKKNYNKFLSLNEDELVNHFTNLLKVSSNKMIPNIAFASLFSGGIDSSVQSKLLSSSKNLKSLIFVDHKKKDPLSKKINSFKKFLNVRLDKIKINKKIYFFSLKKIYQILRTPFYTHDLVGLDKAFNFAKKKKYKVIFNATGVDELWGGYEIYKKVNWSQNKTKNVSPYSSFNKNILPNGSKGSRAAEKLWLRAYNKYNSFTSKKDSRILASLFCDYFVQGVGVHNFGWHIIGGSNSIEVRNIFINKTILKNIVNVPVKYKINHSHKKNFKTKYLLKKIFNNLFNEKLIFKKQGFSGFPNESLEFLKTNEISTIKFYMNKFNQKFVDTRSIIWKILNIFYFKKFCYKNLNFDKIYH